MERTKNDGKLRWKQTGGSAWLKIDGKTKIVKPNETFRAKPEDVPDAFRDTIICLDDVPGEGIEKVEKVEAVKTEYFVKHKGGGRWVIIDANDKQVNEGFLTKEEALEQKAALEK